MYAMVFWCTRGLRSKQSSGIAKAAALGPRGRGYALGCCYWVKAGAFSRTHEQAPCVVSQGRRTGDGLSSIQLWGRHVRFGRGVPQDHAAAVFWYRKAAEQGYARAQV